jgi:hypothetical protein
VGSRIMMITPRRNMRIEMIALKPGAATLFQPFY